MKKVKVAVVGVVNPIGHELLKTMAERSFPASSVTAFDTPHNAGGEVSYGEVEVLTVHDLSRSDFDGFDLCIFASTADVAKDYVPKAKEAGCFVIDGSSAFRMDPDVALIVPEVNSDALSAHKSSQIATCPNPISIALSLALKPLHDAAKVKRAVVTTFQSVSGKGHPAMDELFTQTRSIFVNDNLVKEQFHKQIAFNVIPQIGNFMEDGMTHEEWQIMTEVKKVLDPKIKVASTCVRVPTFIGHAVSVNVECEESISGTEARVLFKKTKGLSVIDHQNEDGFATPVECVGEDSVFVSRIRDDMTSENGVSFWLVFDNLRKGSALNLVQIAELWVKHA